jgi:DNA-binding cell septation regulator SpoVG
MEKTSTSYTAANWQPIDGHGAFKGIFTVRMPDHYVIHGVSLFEKNGARWITLPKRRHTDSSGQFVWSPVIEIVDKPLFESFCVEALEALDALRKENAESLR